MGKKITTEDFIAKSRKIHGDKYDYSLVVYKSWNTKVKIICPIHGVFEQIPNSHHNGSGCTYEYDKVQYRNTSTPVQIRCKDHGYFWQKPSDHLSGCGCPVCSQSQGEKCITHYLDSIDVEYETQKKFEGCKNIFKLPFDFYLPKYNILVEYQGKQHYIVVERYGGEEGFRDRQMKDQIKRDFCKNEGIIEIEIPYWDYDKIELILENRLAQLSPLELLKAI